MSLNPPPLPCCFDGPVLSAGRGVPSRWQQESEADVFGVSTSTGINFDKYDEIPVEVEGHNVPP